MDNNMNTYVSFKLRKMKAPLHTAVPFAPHTFNDVIYSVYSNYIDGKEIIYTWFSIYKNLFYQFDNCDKTAMHKIINMAVCIFKLKQL
jgi:hypothetical protein